MRSLTGWLLRGVGRLVLATDAGDDEGARDGSRSREVQR